MQAKTVEKVVKNSIAYGIAVTQPFAFNIDAQAIQQDHFLTETGKIEYGEHSKIVRHLQLKLKKLGYYQDKIDGVYGLYTERAVKGFQSSETIEVTGQIDKETLQLLTQSEKKAEMKKIKDILFAIQYGERSKNVRTVQEVLFYYGDYQGAIDGIYGPLTEEAIHKVKSEFSFLQTDVAQSGSTTHVDQTKPSSKEQEKKQSKEIMQLEVTTNHQDVVQAAKDFIGTPYVWGGTSPSGFDCSGFIQFVYAQKDVTIPRTVNEIWNFSSPISSPSIGDLVFFETYQPGPSHLGIYLGGGDFIHAGSSNGVQISNFQQNAYWKSRYLGAKRIP